MRSDGTATLLAAFRAAMLLLCALLPPLPAAAHKASDAYLFIETRGDNTQMRWDIALRDLDAALPLDADGDRQLTWRELRSAWASIDALALAALSAPGCRFEVTGHALERRNDGAYAVLLLRAPCTIDERTPLRYTLFADVDPTHRGILKIQRADGSSAVRLLDPQQPAAVPAVSATPASVEPGTAAAFLREGVHHIVTGYDHLLFLFCLLLPAVLRREDGRWQAVDSWRAALWPVAKTVTLFTLAHSVTLALATLGWVRLSPAFVEPAIAVTIILAALDNIRPLIGKRRGWVTFFFGLIHGFGFAGVLGELQLPPAAFGWALFQFNLGLELGQLAMVLLVVPMLYLLRRRRLYVPGVMVAGSAAAMLLAAVWLFERTADVSLLPF
ncbi:HupE/UreJ family protein [Aquincola sp. S2]|uniref:HupE/UreJ family protein n=1 Tax=Pseudaquabacterium terrae TaxID=2732868 RepID=A0ABX2EJB3_9BURK|nr:HupE/UreJ family protein [Aquabacterium terrae]NRF68680.1 HupE/UreJ family protein [Aquabacterium terrae]